MNLKQKQIERLTSKIKLLENNLKILKFELTRLQVQRAIEQEYPDCRICKESLLEDYGRTCSWRKCLGDLCVKCSQQYLCAQCSIPLCQNDYRTDDEGQICCYGCTDPG